MSFWKKGADADASDRDGYTALMRVAVACDPIDVGLIVAKASDSDAPNAEEQALAMSDADDLADMVRLLLDHGANINAKDRYGETALMKAVVSCHTDVAKVLQAHGAKVTLIAAAMLGDIEKVQKFIEEGTDINATTPNGLTPLIAAAVRGHVHVGKLLLDKGANVNAKGFLGMSALILAAQIEQVDMVKLLLDRGADVNAKDTYGRTPLMWAAEVPLEGDLEVIKTLVENGADVNAKMQDGKTALGLAQARGRTDVVQYLRAHGAK